MHLHLFGKTHKSTSYYLRALFLVFFHEWLKILSEYNNSKCYFVPFKLAYFDNFYIKKFIINYKFSNIETFYNTK
jgi:hypothetical protein